MLYGHNEILQIVEDINTGTTLKEVAIKNGMSEVLIKKLLRDNRYEYDKKEKYWANYDERAILIKKLLKDNGFEYDQEGNMEDVYVEREIMSTMDKEQLEEEIAHLSMTRYFDRYKDLYPPKYDHGTEKVEVHKGLYEELEEMSNKIGCTVDALIELALLRFLDRNKKMDLTILFRGKTFKELGFDEKEQKILMKYDENYFHAISEYEDLCKDNFDEEFIKSESIKLGKYYKKFLKEKNIDISDMDMVMKKKGMNEFRYLQSKYKEVTGDKVLPVEDVMK